jgi:hypothetical protein
LVVAESGISVAGQGKPAASGSGEKPMHASFRPCARSSSKVIFGLLLTFAPLLVAQNTTVPTDVKKELPDAPMPVSTAVPTENKPSFTPHSLAPSFDTNRAQAQSWIGKSPSIERPSFTTKALASEVSRPGGKDVKVAGKSPVNWFALDPTAGHANRTAAHNGSQWYTNHIPLAGPIMRQGLKISKAHPHLTTVIKTIKPKL